MKPWTKADEKPLSGAHVRILRIVGESKSKGVTRSEIIDRGANDTAELLGPKFVEDVETYERKYGKRSLISLGLVRGEVVPNGLKNEVRYFLTDRGASAMEYYKVLDNMANDIPGDVLDPVVMSMRKRRMYGFERWTRDDLDTLRGMLPGEFIMHDLEDIRRQMINRRKQGFYADEGKTRFNKKMAHLRKLVKSYWSDEIPLEEVVDFIKHKGNLVGEAASSDGTDDEGEE